MYLSVLSIKSIVSCTLSLAMESAKTEVPMIEFQAINPITFGRINGLIQLLISYTSFYVYCNK